MPEYGYLAIAGLGGYLLGSIPFGVVLARRRGVDVREKGSGNIGATNVARTVGKKLGLIVLLLDAAKGALPLATYIGLDWPTTASPYAPVVIGLAPILGHCFSPWLRFAGGKGVATSLGVILVAEAWIAGAAVLLFAAVYALTRIVSLSSLSAAALTTALFFWDGPGPSYAAMSAGATLIIFVQHRGNLRRLIEKRELPV